tara:strand:+ start:8327 stop:8707 length:381 start_codon:yes stop_codon:yes gene_type:complete
MPSETGKDKVMVNVYSLVVGMLLFFVTHIFIWFQINGQFIWKWFSDNPMLLALLGAPVSYLLILSTKYMVAGFGGLLWPGRLVGFSLGMIVFAILTWLMLGESFSAKTIVSLILAIALVAIQILWK